MRKRISIVLCIFMLLAISLAGLAGCVGGEIILPEIKPPPEEKPSNPVEPTQVTFLFTPIAYDGVNYNGETGVGHDVYVANLKATVKVTEGTCTANITIKSVTITTRNGEGTAESRPATDAEMAKFKLSDSVIREVTTEDKEIVVKVIFGDFSNEAYYGALFNFELQADPYIV